MRYSACLADKAYQKSDFTLKARASTWGPQWATPASDLLACSESHPLREAIGFAKVNKNFLSLRSCATADSRPDPGSPMSVPDASEADSPPLLALSGEDRRNKYGEIRDIKLKFNPNDPSNARDPLRSLSHEERLVWVDAERQKAMQGVPAQSEDDLREKVSLRCFSKTSWQAKASFLLVA